MTRHATFYFIAVANLVLVTVGNAIDSIPMTAAGCVIGLALCARVFAKSTPTFERQWLADYAAEMNKRDKDAARRWLMETRQTRALTGMSAKAKRERILYSLAMANYFRNRVVRCIRKQVAINGDSK